MCVIAVVPKGATLPSFTLFKKAWDTNPHGAGFMYPTPEGELIVVKGLMSFTDFKETFISHRSRFAAGADTTTGAGPVATADLCVHFRIRSHGPVDASNTHPHFIKGHRNVAIAHNGIIRGLPTHAKLSDTMIFARNILAHLPQGWHRNASIQYLIQGHVGEYNKIVLFDGQGLCAILNEKQGTTLNDVWWSNRHHFASFEPVRTHSPVDAFSDDAPPAPAVAFNPKPEARPKRKLTIIKAAFDAHDEAMHLIVDTHEGLGKCTMRVDLAQAMELRKRLACGDVESECQLSGGVPFTAMLRAFYKAVKHADLPPVNFDDVEVTRA